MPLTACQLPPCLHKGSRVTLLSPAGAVDPQWVQQAATVLSNWGLQVNLSKHVLDTAGRFAGSDVDRLADLQQAINDPLCEAIFCSRGGYGVVRLLEKIDGSSLRKHPKWLIGFSDISALHQAFLLNGACTIHGGMAKAIAAQQLAANNLHRLLFEGHISYACTPHPLNRYGQAKGRLVGGNLSVLYGLQGTPWALRTHKRILVLEDLAEPMYHIDRMLHNLKLSGALKQLAGLVVGQFTQINNDNSFDGGVYGIIWEAVKDYDYPVIFDFPIGHTDNNQPLILGAKTQLTVTQSTCIVTQ